MTDFRDSESQGWKVQAEIKATRASLAGKRKKKKK